MSESVMNAEEQPFEASFVPSSKVFPMPDVERLTEAENSMLRAAVLEVTKAEAIKSFLLTRIGARYNLLEGDQISQEGVIIRKR